VGLDFDQQVFAMIATQDVLASASHEECLPMPLSHGLCMALLEMSVVGNSCGRCDIGVLLQNGPVLWFQEFDISHS